MNSHNMRAEPPYVQTISGVQTGNTPNIIAFNGVPVMTTERLAHAYGTDPQRIIQNYNRNKARFVQGRTLSACLAQRFVNSKLHIQMT